jgi:hypothetical protein
MVGQMDYTLASSGEGVCPLRVEGCQGGAGRLLHCNLPIVARKCGPTPVKRY